MTISPPLLKRCGFFERLRPEIVSLVLNVLNSTQAGLLGRENKCDCNLSLYNQLLIWRLQNGLLASWGQHVPPFLSFLWDYSIMIRIHIILSMGYSALLSTTPKMKSITSACNQLGDGRLWGLCGAARRSTASCRNELYKNFEFTSSRQKSASLLQKHWHLRA